ncbi:MAG: uroporphyrinogen-III C-methyltransferase [Acidimicrobiales bacterium]
MTVHLVGAGPGDPDLLTLRAARLLGEADVVVYDRLVGEGVLDLVAPWAECIDVGKDPEGRRTSQDAINQLLVELGRRYDSVVRLKGGDPFVFGRGGEEAEVLTAAGITVDVVPGLSSALAGPAAAGLPVTHRGRSSGFTVITAHQDPASGDGLDWDAAARLGTTLVVLMGARRAGAIARRLLSAGMAATTPVAVVTNATRPEQTEEYTDLVGLVDLPVRSPSVLVIGAVAATPVLAPTVAVDALADLSFAPAP